MIDFLLNNKQVAVDLPAGKPVLDVLRRHLEVKGIKEGCHEGDCGACAALIGSPAGGTVRYLAVNTCILPLAEVNGRHIVTVEGLNLEDRLNLIQECFAEEFASQCGFCTPGFIVSLTGYLLNAAAFDEAEALDAVAGNICRCTGYTSIKRALSRLLAGLSGGKAGAPGRERVEFLVAKKVLPGYFIEADSRLKELAVGESSVPEGARQKIIVGGGTDLWVQRPEELEKADLEFTGSYRGFNDITLENGVCSLGASVTFEDIRNSELINKIYPGAKEAFKMTASALVRNRATVAGNVINASPAADMTIFLLALDAVVCLRAGQDQREIPLKNFFKEYKKTDLQAGEIIEVFKFVLPSEGAKIGFEKVAKRRYLDIASVNCAMRISLRNGTVEDIGIAAGGVAPIPLYLEKTCGFLRSRELSAAAAREAAVIADSEISPISDIRGSAEYKRLLLRQLIFAHFANFFPERIDLREILSI